ncbi:MAG: hypothetical protein JJU26_01900, partial [Oceanicaulis sp.]|nr:hypothetical protein [Oceanicaulis sp.]
MSQITEAQLAPMLELLAPQPENLDAARDALESCLHYSMGQIQAFARHTKGAASAGKQNEALRAISEKAEELRYLLDALARRDDRVIAFLLLNARMPIDDLRVVTQPPDFRPLNGRVHRGEDGPCERAVIRKSR